MRARKISLKIADGKTSGLLRLPTKSAAIFVMAHGAGAGMEHPFLENLSAGLAKRGIASLRFNFPYMEAGKRRPDSPAVAKQAIAAALERAKKEAPSLPCLLGGKSFGGRMASQLAAEKSLSILGLVYLGFPLHPPDKPATKRAAHLPSITVPQLFLQGTRDKLADLALMKETVAPLKKATLLIIDGADHGFDVLKRSGRTPQEVLDELADSVMQWTMKLV
ncbi:MAG: dienelactone hydrolase family protein [Bdellovibrionaceae bacterium]|nr:dienelactone hydrolase family protein [Pseudobdellovibrionaceae bacterium]